MTSALFVLFWSFSAYAGNEIRVPETRDTAVARCGKDLALLIKKRNRGGSDEDYFERRDILEASLPAYSRTAEVIRFEYEQPGLKFTLDTGPYSGSHTEGAQVKKLTLTYDPTKFSRLSIIRRTLGTKPRTLTEKDLRFASQTAMISDEGTFMELYIKGHASVRNPEESGGLIMINRDTGQIRIYASGTDVDGTMGGIIRGSGRALWNFAKGLAGEVECATCKYTGSWSTDPHIIDASSQEIGNEPSTPKRLPGD